MATKTITLDVDAYEHLKAAKRKGESFSSVVRRAVFPANPPTGRELLEMLETRSSRAPEKYLSAVEAAAESDNAPDDPWM